VGRPRIRRDSLVSSYTLGSLIIQNIVMPSPPSTKLPVLSVLPSPIWICSTSRKPRCSYTSRECLVVASNQAGTPSSAAFWRYGSTKARIMPAFETFQVSLLSLSSKESASQEFATHLDPVSLDVLQSSSNTNTSYFSTTSS